MGDVLTSPFASRCARSLLSATLALSVGVGTAALLSSTAAATSADQLVVAFPDDDRGRGTGSLPPGLRKKGKKGKESEAAPQPEHSAQPTHPPADPDPAPDADPGPDVGPAPDSGAKPGTAPNADPDSDGAEPPQDHSAPGTNDSDGESNNSSNSNRSDSNSADPRTAHLLPASAPDAQNPAAQQPAEAADVPSQQEALPTPVAVRDSSLLDLARDSALAPGAAPRPGSPVADGMSAAVPAVAVALAAGITLGVLGGFTGAAHRVRRRPPTPGIDA